MLFPRRGRLQSEITRTVSPPSTGNRWKSAGTSQHSKRKKNYQGLTLDFVNHQKKLLFSNYLHIRWRFQPLSNNLKYGGLTKFKRQEEKIPRRRRKLEIISDPLLEDRSEGDDPNKGDKRRGKGKGSSNVSNRVRFFGGKRGLRFQNCRLGSPKTSQPTKFRLTLWRHSSVYPPSR